MFKSFMDFLEDTKNSICTEITKFKNSNFMEATMAGCAMIAAADGTISSDEKQKMIGFIGRSDALKVFDINDCIKLFQKFVEMYEFDKMIGEGECLKVISKIKGNEDQAKLLIRVCCAIGAADGDFDFDEKTAVIKICKELGLAPSQFGL